MKTRTLSALLITLIASTAYAQVCLNVPFYQEKLEKQIQLAERFPNDETLFAYAVDLKKNLAEAVEGCKAEEAEKAKQSALKEQLRIATEAIEASKTTKQCKSLELYKKQKELGYGFEDVWVTDDTKPNYRITNVDDAIAYQTPYCTQSKLPGVKIGMTAKQVIEKTSWGKPKEVNKTTTRYGTHEQWVYGGRNYLYFENGILTSVQN